MNTLRCIAIDDEELALELLEDNISKVPFLDLAGSCHNPLEAMKLLQKQPVDLIFLDIQMPGLTGLQFIQSKAAQDAMFILITAYEQYALEGFNLNVVDYLVKPVELDRFFAACNKALELHKLRTGSKTQPSNDFFFVNVEYSLVKIEKQDVSYVEGLKDYLKIHLKSSGKPVVTRMSFKALEEELTTPQFIRIHKSYIVSIAAISSIRKNSVFVKDTELPIGESYREALLKAIGREH